MRVVQEIDCIEWDQIFLCNSALLVDGRIIDIGRATWVSSCE